MRKILNVLGTAMAVASLTAGVTFAQDDGPPNFVPLEMQACTYRDGKDSDDLEDALDEMVEWMEEEDSAPYAAWTLNKFYTDPGREFDFLYLGAWPDGSTMGRDIAQYMATAGDAIAAYGEVADCAASGLWASLQVKAPPESDGQGDGFMVSMSDCKIADGRRTSDAIAAVREFGAYRDANGSPGGTYVWFPAYGGPSETPFDFKLINTHQNVEAFGNFYQWFVEHAAYNRQNELLDGLLDCDVARLYVGDTVVNTFPME